MQRTRLEEVILKVKMLKLGKAQPFLETVLDPPDSETLKLSIEVNHNLSIVFKTYILFSRFYRL